MPAYHAKLGVGTGTLAAMRITANTLTRTCAVCERTLLMGERATRFSPGGSRDDYVDVCPLCQEIALEHGWIKEGSPTTPRLPAERRRGRGRTSLVRLLAPQRRQAQPPVVSEPILRRLSEPEQAAVEAANLFNESDHRRSVAGIAKSLGRPRASIVSLSGVNAELVITVAWDISWYQYRVSAESLQPVRLAERGHEPGQLEPSFTSWNARVEDDGRVVPNISRV
jgi:hypothetical protein